MKIAVLLTCHNRRVLTIRCLNQLDRQLSTFGIDYDIHLTDDGCTDGTAEEVLKEYPNTFVYKGKNLYWAGGMRKAWQGAISRDIYDYYLLLNDDTFVNEYLVPDFLECRSLCHQTALIVGNVCDEATRKPTYIGVRCISRFPYKCESVPPSGRPSNISFAGANIWFVPADIVKRVGIFPNIYVHAIADNDYCWRVKRAGFEVIGSSHYCGYCTADHRAPTREQLQKMSIAQRWQWINAPKGQELKQYLYFQYHFLPWRVPAVLLRAMIKVLLGL